MYSKNEDEINWILVLHGEVTKTACGPVENIVIVTTFASTSEARHVQHKRRDTYASAPKHFTWFDGRARQPVATYAAIEGEALQLDRLPRWLVGENRGERAIRFKENGLLHVATVPNDSLWGAVKDNIILREYERVGISLKDHRGVVVDAGAHVGLFSLRAANYASRVVSLEPHPGNYALLKRNIEANSYHHVEIRPQALWNSAGVVDLHEGDHSGAGSILKAGNSFRVPTLTLAEIVDEVGNIDLLKLDIEGAEFPVLEAAEAEVLEKIGTIVAELHVDRGVDGQLHLIERLRFVGFAVSVLRSPIYSPRESLGRVLSSWRRLKGLTRLKIAVLGVYGVFAVLLPILFHRSQPDFDGVSFLYAVRNETDLRLRAQSARRREVQTGPPRR